MRRVLLTIILILSILMSGCMYCSFLDSETTTTVETTTTNTIKESSSSSSSSSKSSERSMESSYLSSVVSSMNAPTTVPTTRIQITTKATTTTIIVESCSDGLRNQDEFLVDCGGVCQTQCSVFNLTRNGDAVSFQGYSFSLKDSKIKGDNLEYNIKITTWDGYTDNRTVNVGLQSWVDTIKFKIEDGDDVRILVSAKIDSELTAKTPSGATVLTIGGQSCVQSGGRLCSRIYNGYEITLINRVDGGGVKVNVKHPDGIETKGTAYQNGTEYKTGEITIGILKYVIPGGYSNIYAKPKGT